VRCWRIPKNKNCRTLHRHWCLP